jgi:hypothetical protein
MESVNAVKCLPASVVRKSSARMTVGVMETAFKPVENASVIKDTQAMIVVLDHVQINVVDKDIVIIRRENAIVSLDLQEGIVLL